MAISPANNPIADYFKTSYHELTKVTWPTRQQATKHAVAVVVASIVVAIFFGIIDYLLTLGLERLI